jgi:hypothetical protein
VRYCESKRMPSTATPGKETVVSKPIRSPYLVAAEIAKALGVTRRTFEYWIQHGKIEVPERDSDTLRYKWTPAHVAELMIKIRTGQLKVKKDSRRLQTVLRKAS